MTFKVLITGKSGQLGQEFFDQSQSHKFDFFFASRIDADLRNPLQTSKLIANIRPNLIIHTAAKVGGIQFNIDNDYLMLYDNLCIDLNVVKGALDNKVDNLIYFSSSCVYPIQAKQPFLPESIFDGRLESTNEYYAIAKSVISKLLSGVDKNSELNYKTFILSNLYGKYDNFGPIQSHVLAAAYRKILLAKKSGKNKVEIWGDGTPRREFTLASDVAHFTLMSISNLSSFPSVINLGSGVDYSVREIYEIIKEVLDYKGKFSYSLDMPIGMKAKLMNSDFAIKNLNWAPQTDLFAGISSELLNSRAALLSIADKF